MVSKGDYYDVTNITTILTLSPYYPYSAGAYLILILLNILIIVLAVIGNGVVLYASKLYNAIKMDKVSLIFLENLAVADIMLAIVFYLPITLTLITKRWILGSELCFANAFFTSTPSVAEIWILTAISVHRIYAVRNPFGASISSKKVYGIVTLLWIIGLLPPAIWLAMDNFSFYDPYSLSCVSSVYTRTAGVALIGSVLVVGIPLIIVVTCNIYLLYVSISHNQRMGQGMSGVAVVTITTLCWTFVISWLPYVLKVILNALDVPTPPWFYLVQIEMLGLNVTLNPLIYTFTNRRFREFLWTRVLRGGRRCGLLSGKKDKPPVVFSGTARVLSGTTPVTSNL